MNKHLLFLGLFLSLGSIVMASDQSTDRVINLQYTPQGWSNSSFAICYYNDKSLYYLPSTALATPGRVFDLKVSPAYIHLAVLHTKGNSRAVSIYSTIDGSRVCTFRLDNEPTAIAYSPNAKYLAIADKSRVINVYDARKREVVFSIPTAFAPQRIAMSSNDYYVAASNEDRVYVWNMETGKERKALEIDGFVNNVTFSSDNATMAILVETGKLYLYDTKSFSIKDTYEGLGDAIDCRFHPEGKYITVVTAPNEITIVNMKNPDNRERISTKGNGICGIGYITDFKKNTMLVYNNDKSFVFHSIGDLVPDYTKLLSDEVEEQMDEWLKQMPGETLEEYQLRVNEETRKAQYAKIENELATELAGDQVGQAEISFGSYNQEESMLEVNFDNMPSIYLDVPQEDVAEFSNPQKLTFENSVYSVNDQDQFELIYTEVTNTETGKKYVFDNLDKQSLDYMASNDNFVPLDLIQQSSMEEIKLQEIREQVVETAKEEKLISEHTHIDVKTKVEASTNADGEKIMNYCVDFNYNVEEEFSAAEDFPAGVYDITQSKSATAMLQIIQQAFQNEFAQYIRSGKKVKLIVTGSADAAPIKSKIAYKNEYGAQEDAFVTINEQLKALTVTSQTGITSNEQLAFLRALSVQDYVEQHLTTLEQMKREYEYIANVSNERGSEFRRIGIRFVFIDAFDQNNE